MKMAGWRCVICFAFIALTLKVFLSHINTAHGRSRNFRVICGIDGCKEEYRVFNSFYYHIKRRHAAYLSNGRPPRDLIPVSSRCHGGERFDMGLPIFSNCITPATHQVQDSIPTTNMRQNTTQTDFREDDACQESGGIEQLQSNKEKVGIQTLIEFLQPFVMNECKSIGVDSQGLEKNVLVPVEFAS